MTKPSVSVIMPVLNRERYVVDALDSVRAQTYPNWEVVVSDGGSTDATMDVLRRYAAEDPRIRVFSHPGTNAPEGRNAALAECRHDYIAVLDSDDKALDTRLALQVDFLERHPDFAGVGSDVAFIDSDGNGIRVDKFRQRLTDPDELRHMIRNGWSCFVHSSLLFRRDALLDVGGYRPVFRFAEDDDLFLRLVDRHRLTNLQEPLVEYRWHGENSSGKPLPMIIHRLSALASAHMRMAHLPDPLDDPANRIELSFLLSLFSRLGEKSLPVRLAWIGLLQFYRVREEDMLLDAWRGVAALPHVAEFDAEIRRHWRTLAEKSPEELAYIVAECADHPAASIGRRLYSVNGSRPL